jgi:hypothetical protein
MNRFRPRISANPTELLELLGYAVVALGFALVYLPLGLIVAGGVLVFLTQGVES